MKNAQSRNAARQTIQPRLKKNSSCDSFASCRRRHDDIIPLPVTRIPFVVTQMRHFGEQEQEHELALASHSPPRLFCLVYLVRLTSVSTASRSTRRFVAAPRVAKTFDSPASTPAICIVANCAEMRLSRPLFSLSLWLVGGEECVWIAHTR